jgi:hypothetical protein
VCGDALQLDFLALAQLHNQLLEILAVHLEQRVPHASVLTSADCDWGGWPEVPRLRPELERYPERCRAAGRDDCPVGCLEREVDDVVVGHQQGVQSMSASVTRKGIRTFVPGAMKPDGSTMMLVFVTPARNLEKVLAEPEVIVDRGAEQAGEQQIAASGVGQALSAAVFTCCSLPRPMANVRSSIDPVTSRDPQRVVLQAVSKNDERSFAGNAAGGKELRI